MGVGRRVTLAGPVSRSAPLHERRWECVRVMARGVVYESIECSEDRKSAGCRQARARTRSSCSAVKLGGAPLRWRSERACSLATASTVPLETDSTASSRACSCSYSDHLFPHRRTRCRFTPNSSEMQSVFRPSAAIRIRQAHGTNVAPKFAIGTAALGPATDAGSPRPRLHRA